MKTIRSKTGNRPPVSQDTADDQSTRSPLAQVSSEQRKFDSAEVLRLMDFVSEVRRTSFNVIQEAINFELSFSSRDFPSEVFSKKEPPIPLGDRTDGIVIDGALGLYDSSTKKITVFPKGIKRAAEILKASPNDLKQIVLLHEWAHALLHLGLAKADRQSEMQMILFGPNM